MKTTSVILLLCASLAVAGDERPLSELPYTPSLEPAFMDRTVDPCVDFYSYSCGGWMKQNPIPPDQAAWSVYGKLHALNEQYLWGILEAAAAPDPQRDPVTAQIGDYFAACMDTATVDKRGGGPLEADLATLAALETKAAIAGWLAGAHLSVDGGILFGFSAAQAPGDSARVIAWAYAAGLGLPDRDYYLTDDERSREIRAQYRDHVAAMLELSGLDAAAAKDGAATVLRLETALATASLTRVEQRDPYATFNTMKLTELAATTSDFAWKDYLAALGLADLSELNVTEPRFFAALGTLLAAEDLAAWKTYLRWHLVSARAPYLAERFVRADFAFNLATLRGVKELAPRWKRCVRLVDRDLGEALGKVFVERSFPPAVKAETVAMTEAIEAAMAKRVAALPWMSEATKQQALAKLRTVRNKVGYPDRFRDYSAVVVTRDDFAGNVDRAQSFESRRQLAKIGRPVDRGEWGMTPPTVNAYYNPAMNDVNFPAGVLLPPLYDPKMDAAPNFGNTGGTIGHELTHGFDDSGRQYDAAGNLRDWWTAADAAEFERRTKCIADQYAEYVVVDDIHVNSELTLGEDVADLGGMLLAWDAWRAATAGQELAPKDDLTPEQRFFVGFAQWACENQRPEVLRVNAVTDPHSPGVYRINGVVANLPEFATAFACEAGKPLVRETVCRVW